MSVGVVIPTLGREAVLCETVEGLLRLARPPDEIVVVDQTERHESATQGSLERWDQTGCIRWIRQASPSIPTAMNRGLLAAASEVVLFVDDDVVPDPRLAEAHARAWAAADGSDVGLIAGRVVQPWDDEGAAGVDGFSFAQREPAWVDQFIGCNFSVRRETAIRLGGFDESFEGAAYRFEAEFADRVRRAGYKIRFEPTASLHHLHAGSGGTRAGGHHLRTWKPHHAVGAYYYLMRSQPPGWVRQMLARPLRSIRTRHHLRRPWWILPTLVAEVRGWWKALRLRLRPPGTLKAGGAARVASFPQDAGGDVSTRSR
ncbi:MAG: glycosyltransferase family 2 protein [Planctomycetes bacterium]|nr:glycosyltransferase family 2 protein [Planctomycetota bacterium]MCB9828343.1 glycosyltransferase family 2 protein [Planctomycetota bacterium]